MSVAEAAALGITCLPMRVCFDDAEYLAGVNLPNDTFFAQLAAAKNLPKTMQINENDYKEAIQPLLDAGDEVFVMAISSGLSGTFNSLQLASAEINSPKLKIFDTETFTLAYYALVREALKLIQQGVTLAELETKMNALKAKVRIVAVIDNVKYLIKGGRLNLVKGLLAAALHIKPIISVKDKKLAMIGKAMGYNGAKAQVARLVTNVDESMPIYYGHGNAAAKAEDFKQIFPFKYAEKREIGPIIGTHGGPGCVGIAYFEK